MTGRDSSLRTRERRYRFNEHGASSRNRFGNYILKSQAVEAWSPGYEKGATTIRILPGLIADATGQLNWDYDRNTFQDSQAPGEFGDWIRKYPVCRGAGDPSVTYIENDPANPQIEDLQMTPLSILRRAIERAVNHAQDRPGWAAMIKGGQNRRELLPKQDDIYLVQCILLQHNGKLCNPPKGWGQHDKTVVFEMGKSAGMALLAELQREVPGYVGDPDNFEQRFVTGNPVSLDYGRFFTFYTKNQGDPRDAQAQQNLSWQNQQNAQQGRNWQQPGQQQQKEIGYGCYSEPTFNGLTANLRQYETTIRAKVLPWDEIIYIPTIEQQAAMLADKFPPEVIVYAWGDTHPNWVPEEIRRRAVAAMSVQMPGAAYGSPMAQGSPQGGHMYGPSQGNVFGGMPSAFQQPQPQGGYFDAQGVWQQAPPQQSWGSQQMQQPPQAPPQQGWGAPPQQQQPPLQLGQQIPVGQAHAGMGMPPAQQLPTQQPPVQQPPVQQPPVQQPPAQQSWGGSAGIIPATTAPTQQPQQSWGGQPPQQLPGSQPHTTPQQGWGAQQMQQPPQQMQQPPQQTQQPPQQNWGGQPAMTPGQPAPMGWGSQPNPMAGAQQQPRGPLHVQDTAVSGMAIPASAPPVAGMGNPPPGMIPPMGQGVLPAEQPPAASAFDPRPQPQQSAPPQGGPVDPAQLALQRAQQAAAAAAAGQPAG